MAASSTPIMEKATAVTRDFFSAITSSEARYFDEERYSESELRKALNDSLMDKKIDAMKRILAAVSVGRDASALFPDVVKNVSFSSLELKKLIYIYLVQYAEHNRDLALLSINSFQKDLADRSQLVRASALRAMASIKVLEVIQVVMAAVKTAANDSSPYVRKTAAQCMTKVYGVDPDQFFELRALLLKLMSDREVQVVGGAVLAFHHLCILRPPEDSEASEQLALLHPVFRRLCQDVLLIDSWAQQSTIDLLTRYSRMFFAQPSVSEGPEPEQAISEDLRSYLKSLRLLLNSMSQGVTLAASVALCYLGPGEETKAVVRPLLRCLRQAPAESAQALLLALTPIVEARPDLFRPCIRELFVQSFDFPSVKAAKLQLLATLVDESNVQLVLRELQVYVSWHSKPLFVAQAVRTIAQVALKIGSVADHCLRGLVKMLDSKCEALSTEAVVALRALPQQQQERAESGLGSVLPHLVHYLRDLRAPTARASVVWIIGHYQHEIPRLVPDVLRDLGKSFASEPQEVKQQILGLSLKTWSSHFLATEGALPGMAGERGISAEESLALLPRLEALVDHIVEVAKYDIAWDVRDTARALRQVKEATKAHKAAPGAVGAFGLAYCQAVISGSEAVSAQAVDAAQAHRTGAVDSTFIVGSLAQTLDFPLDTYKALPQWASENSPDELRKPKADSAPTATAPKSISSANVGHIQHMEARVQNPSNISHMPHTSNLADLDAFYSDDPASPNASNTTPLAMPGEARLGKPVGTAVFGEDSESEEAEDSTGEDDWKFCQQAPAKDAVEKSPLPDEPQEHTSPAPESPPTTDDHSVPHAVGSAAAMNASEDLL